MLGKSHIAFGTGFYALSCVSLNLPLPEAFYFIPFAVIGSLMPDLDSVQSRLKRNFLIWLITIPLTLFGHRTWSHSLMSLIVLGVPWFFSDGFFFMACLALWIGYASHLLGDWLTHEGIPLFYPLKSKFKSPVTFKTGSFIEFPIALFPLIAALAFLFW